MNAIVTVAIGQRSTAIFAVTGPHMERYARVCAADFVCLHESKVCLGDAKFEKLQLFDLLDRYERIIYLDCDALVLSTCPSLFDVVPVAAFGAYFDSNGGNGDAEIGLPKLREEEIASYQATHGEIGWETTYFNSGVMVIGRQHKPMFSYPAGVARSRHFVDQTFLNYRLQRAGFTHMDIGKSFNHFAALNRSERMFRTRFESHIIHYAGFNEFYPERSICAQIAADVAHVNGLSVTRGVVS